MLVGCIEEREEEIAMFTAEDDFYLEDIFLLESTPQSFIEIFGEAEDIIEIENYFTYEEIIMKTGPDKIIYQFPGVDVYFTGYLEENQLKFSMLDINDQKIEGPRGIKIGDSLDNVISKFYQEEEMESDNFLYEDKYVGNIITGGRIYYDSEEEFAEQVLYTDVYNDNKVILNISFNEEEEIKTITLSRDLLFK